jgi:ribose-phosphate pyrophosphokinase
LEQVVVSNSIPDGIACGSTKITSLSEAKLLAEAIISIHDETSVSRLFI